MNFLQKSQLIEILTLIFVIVAATDFNCRIGSCVSNISEEYSTNTVRCQRECRDNTACISYSPLIHHTVAYTCSLQNQVCDIIDLQMQPSRVCDRGKHKRKFWVAFYGTLNMYVSIFNIFNMRKKCMTLYNYI